MMGPRIEFHATPEELAERLTQMAELTANGSKNWDNYKELVKDLLIQIRDYYIRNNLNAKP